MSRKFAIAIVAAAALGVAALVPTAASARGGFGGGHGMSSHGGGHSIGHSSFSRGSSFRSFHRPSHVGRVSHPHRIGGHHPHRPGHHAHHRPHHPHHAHHHHHHHKKWWAWCHRHHHHHHHLHRWCGYFGYPVIDVAVDATVETTPVASTPVTTAPVAKDACTCLTKSYLPDGSVLFKDVCTKEMAMATPEELKAQAEGAPVAK